MATTNLNLLPMFRVDVNTALGMLQMVLLALLEPMRLLPFCLVSDGYPPKTYDNVILIDGVVWTLLFDFQSFFLS